VSPEHTLGTWQFGPLFCECGPQSPAGAFEQAFDHVVGIFTTDFQMQGATQGLA
jgi:hypothetical protein